jgi:hypothetical protein
LFAIVLVVHFAIFSELAMFFRSLITVALAGSLVVAGPIEHDMIKEQIKKRQEFQGAIPGLPPALAAFVPQIAKSGMLPMILKTIVNGKLLNAMLSIHYRRC